MNADCYPIEKIPNTTRLFRDFAARRDVLFSSSAAGHSPFYASQSDLPPAKSTTHLQELAALLEQQNRGWLASPETLSNIARLRDGAAAVVTGQQVTLFGGPLFTLFKAATAIRKARDLSAAGTPHVPIFWLATEDHDLEEVNQVVFPARDHLSTLHLSVPASGGPVGDIPLGTTVTAALERAAELLGPSPIMDLLAECYQPQQTFAASFARLMARVFAREGLIVVDASSRAFHQLGAPVFRSAIENVQTLQRALVARSSQLAALGYHAQVMVQENSSLLFLIENGARIALKYRPDSGQWRAGSNTWSTPSLLALLESSPERFSPNALLRPVFQDFLLPTSVYIGGPAEIAYFAQSAVLYDHILARKTPIVPRLSATLVEPSIAATLERHQLDVLDSFTSAESLAQHLAARAIPIEGKKHLATAGNALSQELDTLLGWMSTVDAGLASAGHTAASKMRYQMNRLRRLAANHMLERETSLARHARALTQSLYPEGHLQERVLGAAYFLSRYGDFLPATLMANAAQDCPGHRVIRL